MNQTNGHNQNDAPPHTHTHPAPVEVITLTYDPAQQNFKWNCQNISLMNAIQRLELFQFLMFDYARQLPPAAKSESEQAAEHATNSANDSV